MHLRRAGGQVGQLRRRGHLLVPRDLLLEQPAALPAPSQPWRAGSRRDGGRCDYQELAARVGRA